MGNLRSSQVSHSQKAHDQAATNATNANAAVNIPDLKLVVAANSATIQELVLSNQRLERLVDRLIRQLKKV